MFLSHIDVSLSFSPTPPLSLKPIKTYPWVRFKSWERRQRKIKEQVRLCLEEDA